MAKKPTPSMYDLQVLRGQTEVVWLNAIAPPGGTNGQIPLSTFSWVRVNWARFTCTPVDPSQNAILSLGSPGVGVGVLAETLSALQVLVSNDINFSRRAGVAAAVSATLPYVLAPTHDVWAFQPQSLNWGFDQLFGGESISNLSASLQVVRR